MYSAVKLTQSNTHKEITVYIKRPIIPGIKKINNDKYLNTPFKDTL